MNQRITLNFNHKIETLRKYLQLVKIEKMDNYEDWLSIGMCLYNCNNSSDSLSLWLDWSKGSVSYNEAECIRKWNGFEKRTTMAIGYLKYHAKLHSPSEFKRFNNVLTDDYKKKSLKINRKYLLDREKDMNHDDTLLNEIRRLFSGEIKALSMKSQYGSGKTDMIERIIQHYNPEKVLWISYRRSLTTNLHGKFKNYNFDNYMNYDYSGNRLICQIESLDNIQTFDDFIREYDLVILDEIESILNHFESPTIANKRKTFRLMQGFCRDSKWILALDGDFSDRSYKFLEKVSEGKQSIIVNEYTDIKKKMVLTKDKEKFDKMIDEDLKAGKNIAICSMSSSLCNDYADRYEKIYKTTRHNSKSDDKKKDKLEDVNNYWNQFQLIIYSPTIESGVDFDGEHVDKLYCILSARSTSQRAFMQMCARIRKIRDDTINIYANGLIDRKEVEYYSYDDIKEYLREIPEVESDVVIDNATGRTKMIKKVIDFELYDEIKIYNVMESSNKNGYYLIPLLREIAISKGYKFEISEDKMKKDTNSKELRDARLDKMLDLGNSNEEEYQKLKKKQRMSDATEEDKMKMERYYLRTELGLDRLDKDMLKNARDRISKIHNMMILIDERNIKGINSNVFDYDVEKERQKREIILDLVRRLGYCNVFDKEEIHRNILEKSLKEILKDGLYFKDLQRSQLLFGYGKLQDDSRETHLRYLNKIFKRYGFKIAFRNERQMVENVSWNNYYYRLEVIDNINELIECKIRRGYKMSNGDNLEFKPLKRNLGHLYDIDN